MKKATKGSKKPKSKKAPVKEGDKLVCDKCGFTVIVEDAGDSGTCGAMCCEEPMHFCGY
jgi:hypothetical protein